VTTRFLGAVLPALVLSIPALAQSVGLEPTAQPVPASSDAQKYDGVVPGPDARNPLPQAPAGGPYLVWTGFQMTDTGSRVFLQTTEAVPFDVRQGATGKASKSGLAIVLRGCRIHMANNRRKIDTRYFATPVSSVSVRQKGRDVEIRIAVRQEVSVTPRGEVGPVGTQFVVVDFPPGKAEADPDAMRPQAGRAAFSDGEYVRAEGGEGEPGSGVAKKGSKYAR